MIHDHNPWWTNSNDLLFEEWEKSEIRWIPHLLSQFKVEPFSLNFLVGPRQVGKSTALRIYIHQLLKDGINPYSIMYMACDYIANFRELKEVIDTYLDIPKVKSCNSLLIILDEITFVDDWWRTIKDYIDRLIFKTVTLFITGSSSLSILKQKEYFPGRRGNGKDFVFHPMDFNEYTYHFARLKPSNHIISEIDDFYEVLKAERVKKEEYGRLFVQYLKTGGFPTSIIEYHKSGKVSLISYRVYIDWIINDFIKLGHSEGYLKEILKIIIESRSSPLSLNSIKKNTSINSTNTISSYIQLLDSLFIINVLLFRGPDGRVSLRKNRKIHLCDPLLYDALSMYTRSQTLEEHKVEACVATHLSRLDDSYYWRSASTEVDVITVFPEFTFGIEVKWSSKIRKWAKYPEKEAKTITLNKEEIPLFLGNFSWKREYGSY